MKNLILVMLSLVLISCSGSDTSSSVSIDERNGGSDTPFPYATCPVAATEFKCGWVDGSVGTGFRYYIRPGANLVSAELSNANLASANLVGAKLRIADLTGANLTGANLTDGHLKEAKLDDVDLTGADLTGADLEYASLERISANATTICPNGKPWAEPTWESSNGNDCKFGLKSGVWIVDPALFLIDDE